MKTQIRDWEDEFGVESPNQLRGTLTDETLDGDEEDRRRMLLVSGNISNAASKSSGSLSASGTSSL
jgi:hypothetical protein